ncbi:MAG: hypothetical protein BIP78_0101 [Candidatus Bipolaricaulis sibiricus]|uniref:Fibronectin type-III domain-containing protein n=1 Tax=Bipolaricaulis sibiricus TaxID=2501609 RepID=A0A410FRL9_BIPS1|nr:MAG: hypothetical protein BIP78_0101 [Candidatus Bipolaricaulis sibiricus]
MRREARRIVRDIVGVLTALAVGIVLAGCDLLNRINPTLPPDRAPTGVTASLGQFETQIRVTWLSVERATSYRVYRADSRDGDYQFLGSESSLVYTDTVGAANQGRMYWYKVEACNSVGCSPMSTAAAGYAGYPPAPANVRATDRAYPDKIVILWDPVPGAISYQVFRDRFPDGTFATPVGQVETTSIEDTTATVGLAYWYRVRACHATGCSALSDPAFGRR